MIKYTRKHIITEYENTEVVSVRTSRNVDEILKLDPMRFSVRVSTDWKDRMLDLLVQAANILIWRVKLLWAKS